VVYEGSMTDPAGKAVRTRSIARQTGAGQESFELWEEHDGKMVKTLEIALTK